MPLFTSGGLDLGLGLGLIILVLVLVLRTWSCLHHWGLLVYIYAFLSQEFLVGYRTDCLSHIFYLLQAPTSTDLPSARMSHQLSLPRDVSFVEGEGHWSSSQPLSGGVTPCLPCAHRHAWQDDYFSTLQAREPSETAQQDIVTDEPESLYELRLQQTVFNSNNSNNKQPPPPPG